eukprot:5845335-Pyramimonas_sp.AAC.1
MSHIRGGHLAGELHLCHARGAEMQARLELLRGQEGGENDGAWGDCYAIRQHFAGLRDLGRLRSDETHLHVRERARETYARSAFGTAEYERGGQ